MASPSHTLKMNPVYTVWLRLKVDNPADVEYLEERLSNSDTLVGHGRQGIVSIAFLRQASSPGAAVGIAVQEVRALPWSGELSASVNEPFTTEQRNALAAGEEAARCNKCGRMIFCGAHGLCGEPDCPLKERA